MPCTASGYVDRARVRGQFSTKHQLHHMATDTRKQIRCLNTARAATKRLASRELSLCMYSLLTCMCRQDCLHGTYAWWKITVEHSMLRSYVIDILCRVTIRNGRTSAHAWLCTYLMADKPYKCISLSNLRVLVKPRIISFKRLAYGLAGAGACLARLGRCGLRNQVRFLAPCRWSLHVSC